jgi:enoyl-CoA hydratase/carnithine racemase
MSLAIERALSGAGADIKLVRLASTGENFCRGRKSPPIDTATATALAFRQTIAEGPLRLYRPSKHVERPFIGLIQGQAFGVGCALAGLCDLTIASETAEFAMPMPPKNESQKLRNGLAEKLSKGSRIRRPRPTRQLGAT